MPKGKHLPRVTLNCARCGKEFSRVGSDTNRIHCSWECAKPRSRPVRRFVCRHCGKQGIQRTHGRTQEFCSSSCARRHLNQRKREANLALGLALHPRVAKQLLLNALAACRDCGWNVEPAILELHHLDGNRRNNRQSNHSLLCPTCHTLMHYRAKTGQFANNLGLKV